MNLLITRHAQTDYNIPGKKVTGKDHIHLNAEGKRQLTCLETRLQNVKLDMIISSPSIRTLATAEPIAKSSGLNIIENELITEKNGGDWEMLDPTLHDWNGLKGNFENRRPPNGENLLEVRARGRKFFKQICDKHGHTSKTILVVSHGAFLKVLIGDLLGMNLYDSIFKLFIEHCSLTKLEIDSKYKSVYQLKYLGDQQHLLPK